MLSNLSPVEVRDALLSRTDVMLVDVREPAEHAVAHIEGATLIPLRTLPQQLGSLPQLSDDLARRYFALVDREPRWVRSSPRSQR